MRAPACWTGSQRGERIIFHVGTNGIDLLWGDAAALTLDDSVWRWVQGLTQEGEGALAAAWLVEVGRDITALGSISILTILVLSVAGFMAVNGRRVSAVWLLGASAGSLAFNHALKTLIGRERPEAIYRAAEVFTPSFPSAHAMDSASIYAALALLLAHNRRGRARAFVFFVAGSLIVAVGLSRMYLGVHWFTDVLGGWVIGLTWTAACWWGLQKYLAARDRRAV